MRPEPRASVSGMLFCLAILLTSAGALAEGGSSVNELVAHLRAAVAKSEPDIQIAKYLQKVKLTQSLDDTTIEQLESDGVGPKGVEALQALRDASHALPPPAEAVPGFALPAPPALEDLRRTLVETRKLALGYTETLPDFICTENVRRYLDPKGAGSWKETDTLTVKLSYYQQKEDYQLLLVNGRQAAKSYESAGGAISKGEFGSMLLEIFDPATAAVFRWDHWTTLRKRRAIVFSYRIGAAKSHYKIVFDGNGERLTVVAGQHGLVYVDPETNMVLRLTRDADNLPASFPIQRASALLDYDFTDVGGKPFLLPLRAEIRMLSPSGQNRNVVEFLGYRKFSGESSISFELKDK
jgi:hypothetical protein